eukprot:GEMP01018779.1.p1 GENE.GEMP01018779.1~~GEMP01018779.1.p1  ORF type:complete len:705 (+),score=225.16 GEMP01018779.1:45-2117(+)
MLNTECNEHVRAEVEQMRIHAALRMCEGGAGGSCSVEDVRKALDTINKLVESHRIRDARVHNDLASYVDSMNAKLDSDDFRDAVDVSIELSRGQRVPNAPLPDFLQKYFDNSIAEQQMPIAQLEADEKTIQPMVPTAYDKAKATIEKLQQFIEQRENFQKIQRERLEKEINELKAELEETKEHSAAEWREKLQQLKAKKPASKKEAPKKKAKTSIFVPTTSGVPVSMWKEWQTTDRKSSAPLRPSTSSTIAASTAPTVVRSASGYTSTCTPAFSPRSRTPEGSNTQEDETRSASPEGSAPRSENGDAGREVLSARVPEDLPLARLVEPADNAADIEVKAGQGIFTLTSEQDAYVDALLGRELETDLSLYKVQKDELKQLEDIDNMLTEFLPRPNSKDSAISLTSFNRPNSVGPPLDPCILPGEPVLRAQREQRELQQHLLRVDQQLCNIKDKKCTEDDIEQLLLESGTYRSSTIALSDKAANIERTYQQVKERLPHLVVSLDEVRDIACELDQLDEQVAQLEDGTMFLKDPLNEQVAQVEDGTMCAHDHVHEPVARLEEPQSPPSRTAAILAQCDALTASITQCERECDARLSSNAAQLDMLEARIPIREEDGEDTTPQLEPDESLDIDRDEEEEEKENSDGDDDDACWSDDRLLAAAANMMKKHGDLEGCPEADEIMQRALEEVPDNLR